MLTIKEILSITSEIERILSLLLVAVNKGEEGERGWELSFALVVL